MRTLQKCDLDYINELNLEFNFFFAITDIKMQLKTISSMPKELNGNNVNLATCMRIAKMPF